MRKSVFVVCFLVTACQFKDPNKEVERPEKPAAIDTSVIVKGNAAGLVDQYLLQQVNDSAFSGAVFISRNDTMVLCKGYGLSDSSNMTAFTPATLVTIDAFKDFLTASAIMDLYEKEKLKLNDIFSTYFPNAPSYRKNITVHQLLTHASGFYNRPVGDTISGLWQLTFLEKPAFIPGTQAGYSQRNPVLLKAIVEILSGTSFDEYLQKSLGMPLKIKTEPNRIHSFDGNVLANGIHSSIKAKDLFNWMLRLTQGKILPDSLVQKMFTAYFPVKGSAGVHSYGYGCQVSLTRSLLKMVSWGQNNGEVIYYPEEKLMIGVVGNRPGFKAEGTMPGIVQLFFDGYISSNAKETLQGFETKGARIVYTLMVEKGEKYFTAQVLETLEKEGLPENQMFFLEAGQKLIQEKKWTSAKTVYLLLTERFPGNTVAWNDLAEIHLALNNKTAARKCLETSLKLNPGNERTKKLVEKNWL